MWGGGGVKKGGGASVAEIDDEGKVGYDGKIGGRHWKRNILFWVGGNGRMVLIKR